MQPVPASKKLPFCIVVCARGPAFRLGVPFGVSRNFLHLFPTHTILFVTRILQQHTVAIDTGHPFPTGDPSHAGGDHFSSRPCAQQRNSSTSVASHARVQNRCPRSSVTAPQVPPNTCAARGPPLVTKRRSSRACIGNPKPEQETIKGTHAQETSALLQRDAIVGHAEAIRTQSRKPSKAHTHKKRQPTNAGQPHSTRRKEATPQSGRYTCS